MKWNDESFVDLYDLLDVWPDAEVGALRKRISELYAEARENLDHRNHRKRFYYRELYELQLPQARTILLDEAKRQEYDHELQQFWKNKGQPSTPRKPKDVVSNRLAGLPGATSEPGSAPADLAAQFADFADIADDALPPFLIPKPLLDTTTVERRRNHKRRELIKHELVATGFRWMLIGGMAAFAALGMIALTFIQALGLPSRNVLLVMLAILVAISAFSGRQSMRWAKRRTIGYLSKLPYDELLRHSSHH
jgi:hypothetical protein